MLRLQLSPGEGSRNLPLLRSLTTLFARSAAMGIMSGETVTAFDPSTMRSLLDDLRVYGLLPSGDLDLAPLVLAPAEQLDASTAAAMAASVDRLAAALASAPSPVTEWGSMRETIGDELLAEIVGASKTSLRQYASGHCRTPQEIADRLHWIALVVSDLMGAYNAFGIRRWFTRPRSQLSGKSPRCVLGTTWLVNGDAPAKVRLLAEALSETQPLTGMHRL